MTEEPHQRCMTCGQAKHNAQFFSSRYTATGFTANCQGCVWAAAQLGREQREAKQAARNASPMSPEGARTAETPAGILVFKTQKRRGRPAAASPIANREKRALQK